MIKIGLYLSRIQKVYRENTLFRRFDDFDPRADRAQRICKFQSPHCEGEHVMHELAWVLSYPRLKERGKWFGRFDDLIHAQIEHREPRIPASALWERICHV